LETSWQLVGNSGCQPGLATSFQLHRVSKKQANYFCYNYVKRPPNLTIFGTMMANCLKLHEVHLFSTPPN